jgi:alkanesulfonate monooxygenase SsuD/methylene tetrahydromethanopterin reductase-like flavin-dependent oxidoreductase (luciferase family)
VAVADEQVPFAKAGTELPVQPVSPGLRSRIAYGAGSLASAERTGRQGLGLQLSTLNTEVTEVSFEEAQLACVEAYRAEHAKVAGWRSHASVSRQIAPYTNAQEQAELQWLLDRDTQRQGGNSDLPFQFGRVAAGSGEQIAAALADDVALTAADELVIALPFDYPASVVRRILTVAAQDVAPALGWQPAGQRV